MTTHRGINLTLLVILFVLNYISSYLKTRNLFTTNCTGQCVQGIRKWRTIWWVFRRTLVQGRVGEKSQQSDKVQGARQWFCETKKMGQSYRFVQRGNKNFSLRRYLLRQSCALLFKARQVNVIFKEYDKWFMLISVI